ncbi:Hypothetical predicted protein [Paramuricea clavata]|uniref:Uncharacterized protein n=1 Tax=Paramuricea clavata TaxID=317549 RepID=A0A6S7IFY2_PARCT|nr:Hypothetical predicted protein [Paramuricea clavata]
MASKQSDQHSSKIGIYPVNVDGGYNGAPGCGLGCSQQHGLGYCPAFKKMKVKEKWEVVIQSKRCKKCLRIGHRHQQCSRKACDINSCGRPHHYLLHKDPKQMDNGNLNPDAQPFKPDQSGTANVPTQKVKVHSANGNSIEGLAMVDSGSNKSLIRKEFADKLGLVGETKKMKMYVAGGGIKVEDSAEFDLKISPCYDEDIVFNVRAYSVKQPCQVAKTISKKAVVRFPHLVRIVEDLHLNGGPVDILLVTDLPEAHLRMPWKPGHPNLPNNRSVAFERMVSKERQLVKKGKLEVFNKEVKALVDREVVIKLKQEEVDPEEPAWYLPIGEVESPDKTTKCRLVFDAAAKMDGLSLDDALEKGPCLMNSLFDVLIGWRQNGVAFAGDDSKIAQVKSPEAARILKDNTYVDDVAGSETSPEKVKKVVDGIDTILGKGKFAIKAWHSNSPEIDQDGNENPNLWAAGYQWDELWPPEEKFKWQKNVAIMNALLGTHLERCLKPETSVGSPQLHGFSDAGELGYGPWCPLPLVGIGVGGRRISW